LNSKIKPSSIWRRGGYLGYIRQAEKAYKRREQARTLDFGGWLMVGRSGGRQRQSTTAEIERPGSISAVVGGG